ncbi:hypothetical protein GQ55_2G143500 [Panicum hallii var. hallii]|uniref:Uncharacterized protein n=1 Tax=Panicum hallii var. hallii TaxID=1504633 RepID=A0A2T7EPQ4_9POAL|nr:hypothetical protein GQ55_2G143500 [Panicum hallii var. hallii]
MEMLTPLVARMSTRSGSLGTTWRPSMEMGWNPDTIRNYGNTDTLAPARLAHAACVHSAAPRDSSRSTEHHHHHHWHLLVIAHLLCPPRCPSVAGAPPP